MDNAYTAFGLALRSSFPLLGLAEVHGVGLPSVAIGLQTPAGLESEWSGTPSLSRWRGQLGDGEEFGVRWGDGGDLLFTYGDRASFCLDPNGTRLSCAPADAASLDWQRVLLSRVLPSVSIARGREALHASALLTPAGVVAIAAPSGMGKSTLAGELVRRGCSLFTDDVLVLDRGPDLITAHPGTPHMNISAQGYEDGTLGTTLAVLSGERWIAVSTGSTQAREIAAIVILERGPNLALQYQRLDPSPLLLAPFMLGLPDDDQRDATRFALYSDLVDSVRLIRLTAGVSDQPTELADEVESALGLDSAFLAQGAL